MRHVPQRGVCQEAVGLRNLLQDYPYKKPTGSGAMVRVSLIMSPGMIRRSIFFILSVRKNERYYFYLSVARLPEQKEYF